MATDENEQPEPDLPQSFGYKTAWLAVRAEEPWLVAEQLKLRDARPTNWREGLERSYKGKSFASTPVGGWVFVVGTGLLNLADRANEAKLLLEPLSSHFGEAQLFGTHRVVEMHFWARAFRGQLLRGYSYLGERGETLWNEGELSQEERDLGFRFFDERSGEARDRYYRGPLDLTAPDEECVMRLAGKWSIDPTKLEEASQLPGLGVLGEF